MATINVSRSEWQALNELVGWAILDNSIEQNLLKRDTRQRLLDKYALSRRVTRHLMSFNDMGDIANFADFLYKSIEH